MSLCFFHLLLKQVNVLVLINYSYEKICVPDVLKNLNVKVFNIMSRTNEIRHIKWHEAYKCECKFGANVIKDLFGILARDVGEYLDYENCTCKKN